MSLSYPKTALDASQIASAGKNLNTNFKKVPEFLPDRIKDPLAGWLLTCIILQIDRRNNTLDITLEQLAELSGMHSRSVMRKTKVLEAGGFLVVTRVKVGNKNAINRYALRGDTKSVVCGLVVSQRHHQSPISGDTKSHLNRVMNDRQNEMNDRQNEMNDIDILREGEDSLTDDKAGESYAMQQLRAFGLAGHHLRRMAMIIPDSRVDGVIRDAQRLAHENPPAYLVAMVDDGWLDTSAPPSQAKKQPQKQNPFNDQSWGDYAHETSPEDDITQDAQLGEVLDSNDFEPWTPETASTCPTTTEIAQDAFTKLWDATYHQLELQIDLNSFDTWLRNAKYLGTEDGLTRIELHNDWSVEICQYRLYRVIKKVYTDILGHEMEIQFSARERLSTRGENPFARGG